MISLSIACIALVYSLGAQQANGAYFAYRVVRNLVIALVFIALMALSIERLVFWRMML
jgi:hypothetical protein